MQHGHMLNSPRCDPPPFLMTSAETCPERKRGPSHNHNSLNHHALVSQSVSALTGRFPTPTSSWAGWSACVIINNATWSRIWVAGAVGRPWILLCDTALHYPAAVSVKSALDIALVTLPCIVLQHCQLKLPWILLW